MLEGYRNADAATLYKGIGRVILRRLNVSFGLREQLGCGQITRNKYPVGDKNMKFPRGETAPGWVLIERSRGDAQRDRHQEFRLIG